MKVFGWGVFLLGVAILMSACVSDITVPTSGGSRVVNLHLAQQQRSLEMWGFGLCALGLLFRVVGGNRQQSPRDDGPTTRCPECRERVRFDAIKCKHCGARLEPQAAAEARPVDDSAGRAVLIVVAIVALVALGLWIATR